MDELAAADILLVEDSDADAELTIRALRKGNLLNKVVRVRDGVEALEYLFREGEFLKRPGGKNSRKSSRRSDCTGRCLIVSRRNGAGREDGC